MTYAQDLKTRICAEAASPSPVRAVIYARVSTDNESQKDMQGYKSGTYDGNTHIVFFHSTVSPYPGAYQYRHGY